MFHQATVVALCLLTKSSRENYARPFIISGTCKHEAVAAHKSLLALALSSVHSYAPRLRIYSIGSDGDSKRRRAVAEITLQHSLLPTSPIFALLSNLPLFDLLCGHDDLTADIDFRHIFKRFRNTLLRESGVTINRVFLSRATIQRHLIDNSVKKHRADTLLYPADKQNVPLAYSLLSEIARLPLLVQQTTYDHPSPNVTSNFKSMTTNPSPAQVSSRQALRLLGRVYHYLLTSYTNIHLSLSQQLVFLSTAAHLILAIYTTDRGGFIPVQLYFDVMTMIKNIYFSVAKTQVANPNGEFWVVLLGTDTLESLFGTVRTMVGNDTNADQLQLSSRISSAAICSSLLQQYPEWDLQPKRLSLPTQSGIAGQDDRDNINARDWQGNVSLKGIVLQTTWRQGHDLASSILEEFNLPVPYHQMTKDGLNILRPISSQQIVFIGGLSFGEREEDQEETDVSGSLSSKLPQVFSP